MKKKIIKKLSIGVYCSILIRKQAMTICARKRSKQISNSPHPIRNWKACRCSKNRFCENVSERNVVQHVPINVSSSLGISFIGKCFFSIYFRFFFLIFKNWSELIFRHRFQLSKCNVFDEIISKFSNIE